ncbi:MULTISPECIES: PLP-dependent aminotransferase family protein [unclassified Nocardioides]|jgi:DNA-binding transcriptional MocR family regulator|uniref:MocR-like transcription factor YczR n=1 Tax=unclassified Nocardioides TaxID=2615069 RepID=UPI000702B197|nr:MULTISPECIES: PLP-dependent aminotransferase family protein [unclassified Nocardioides]KRC54908.1 GntR family transcriptional regulator [Nocardioides sp. Root79]KRC73748.1 GntR family transcriptional regulator [Nocardioides sp. Root240]
MVQATLAAGRLATLVDGFDRSPAYVGLADALRELIGDGRIGYGTRLPSERDLTEALGVSRTTVTRAYALLRETAYAEARQGSGTFTRLPGGRIRALDRALWPSDVGNGVIDLVCAAATAPPGIAALYAEAAAELPAHLGSHGYFPAGMPALQAAIAATYDARGLPTDPDQVVVTPGALAATAVIGTALAGPRDRVLMESPTYPNAVQALRSGGGRLATITLDPSGWDLDAVGSALARHRPRLVHVMPDFHNPTGLVMTDKERASYARLLARHDATAVVDEAHHLLHLDDVAPVRPFASYSKDAICVGSASKSVWGGLRLGWIRAPHALVDRLTRARVGLDLGAPVLEQLVLTRLLTTGYDDLVEVQRRRLREQRDALVGALHERLPDWTFRVPSGGMALWCHLPAAGATALSTEAERHGVLLAPGPSFAPEGGLDRYVRLPYAIAAAELVEAVDRIADAWAVVTSGRGGSPAPTSGSEPVLVA